MLYYSTIYLNDVSFNNTGIDLNATLKVSRIGKEERTAVGRDRECTLRNKAV